MLKHKVFLLWLLYAVTVVLVSAGLFYLGIPQIALLYDHSYLTVVLLALYSIAEGLSARQAWKISSEQLSANMLSEWLDHNVLQSVDAGPDGSTILANDNGGYVIDRSVTASHVLGLRDMSHSSKVDQSILLDVMADRLHAGVSTIEFVGSRIVWIGIMATILGVIIAFWPLLGGGLAVEMIRMKLGGFFSGLAVAFIPTLASFVFKIALDFGTQILRSGCHDIVNTVAALSETKILPVLEMR